MLFLKLLYHFPLSICDRCDQVLLTVVEISSFRKWIRSKFNFHLITASRAGGKVQSNTGDAAFHARFGFQYFGHVPTISSSSRLTKSPNDFFNEILYFL